MTDKFNESLSALMDNEAEELEVRRILKEMDALTDEESVVELKAKWHRYHIISASLKQEVHTSPSCNLLAGIQAELEKDSIPVGQSLDNRSVPGKGNGILRVLGQGAIAASVTLAVLFTADLVMVGNNESPNGSNAELADSSTSLLPGLTGEMNPATETRVAIQSRLDEEEMSRLQQVVSDELEDTLEDREIPATFIPEENP